MYKVLSETNKREFITPKLAKWGAISTSRSEVAMGEVVSRTKKG